MDLWDKYTTASDRELFASVSNIECGSCVTSPGTLPHDVESVLQKTIDKVFEKISFEEFLIIHREYPITHNNRIIINYIARNFLHVVTGLCIEYEYGILSHPIDHSLETVISELNKEETKLVPENIYDIALSKRLQFPHPGYGGLSGPRGQKGLTE